MLSGHPKAARGNKPEENQVSNTSSSCLIDLMSSKLIPEINRLLSYLKISAKVKYPH